MQTYTITMTIYKNDMEIALPKETCVIDSEIVEVIAELKERHVALGDSFDVQIKADR